MTCRIRRNIHETSSSSASTLTMVSDCGVRSQVKLDKPWICVQGAFMTNGDGYPHEYLTRWQEKMSFLAADNNMWHRMFRRVTGQDFKMYKIYIPNKYNAPDISASIPNAIPIEIDEKGELAKVSGMDYYCGYGLWDDWAVALPADTSYDTVEQYDIVEVFTWIDAILDDEDLKEQLGEELFDKRILEEIIFNPAIALNIGGDAFERDKWRGVINGYLSDEDKNPPLSYAGYSVLERAYRNGNETLILGLDGSKVRICRDETEEPEYPDSIDMKITDCCCNACPFCYENCTPDGENGEIPDALFSSIPPFTEIAVGGGNALLHPEIFDLHDKYRLHMNLTLHAQDFLNTVINNDETWNENALLKFDAVGVSISSVEMAEQMSKYTHQYNYEKWDPVGRIWTYHDPKEGWENYSQLVIHAVNGVITEEMLKPLYDRDLRLLVLGYKTKGRGVDFAQDPQVAANQRWLHDNIEEVAKHFTVTAFDNLALEQLEIRRLVSDEDWMQYYMGDEGTHSMYIDLVKKEYGISSTDDRRWKLTDDLREMFRHVRSVVAQDKAGKGTHDSE